MDPFIKRFKSEIPDTYPVQNDFLPELGLCGTFSNGIFHTEDTLISDKIKTEFSTSSKKLGPKVMEFSSIKETRFLTAAELEGSGIIGSTGVSGNVLLKLFDFDAKNEYYYRAILEDREYIPNPVELFQERVLAAYNKKEWAKNTVVITSILYGKNPILLKPTAKRSIIIGGEISAKLSSSEDIFNANPEFKIEFIRNSSNNSLIRTTDENRTVLGFQMIGLKPRFFGKRKELDKIRGDFDDNNYDVFDDLFTEVDNNQEEIEYILCNI